MERQNASCVRALPLGTIPFGAVILAEPGLSHSEMGRDLENIRRLGFNTVVLYPSVSRWEGNPFGETAFGAIDGILDRCAELGIKVILELQGQVMQDADAPECFELPPGFPHPDYRENGFHMPAKEKLLECYLREVAEHFKGHPALLAYDLFNEIGNDSRSPETIRAFVRFLRCQYNGDIRALNLAWATYFRDFDSIAEVPPNYRVWSWSSVLAERDWQRFRSIDFKEQIAWWRSIIREIDPDIPLFIDVLGSDVLHNRTDSYYGASDWDVVGESDVLGLSCYANMLCENWWERDAWLWPQFWRHALSVAGGKQVIISELMTQNRNLFPPEKSSMEDEILLWSYQAVFHGIKGLIYWKYRPFRRGRQVGGRGLTNASGEPNDAGWQAAEVAQFAAKHAGILSEASPDDSGCAILHDPETERLHSAIGIGVGHAHGSAASQASTFYTDAHRGWFHAFWSKGVQPSYLTPQRLVQGVPDRIGVLVIPCHVNLSPGLAATLRAFVERGGVLVTEGRFGRIDDDGNLWPHAPGVGMHEWSGIEEADFTCRFRDSMDLPGGDMAFHDDYFQKLKLSPSVDVLVRMRSGLPAMVESSVGLGRHLHVAFLLGHKAEQDFSPSLMDCFEILFHRIGRSLKPMIEVLSKDVFDDVSILLDASGKPCLAGLCNYGGVSSTVTLRCPWEIRGHVCSHDGLTFEQESGTLTVRMPGRCAAAFFF